MEFVEYAIRDVVIEAVQLQKQGRQMIWLNIGDPAKSNYDLKMGLTDAIAENVKAALGKKLKGYPPSQGTESLRKKAAEIEGGNCTPDDVFVMHGLTEGIKFLFSTMVNPGDKAVLPNPTYSIYITEANLNGANSAFYRHDENGQIDIGDLEKKIQGAKFAVIINPNNPLGSVYSEGNLRAAVEVCARHEVPVFYDGAYDRLTFGEPVDFRKIADGKIPYIYGSSVSKIYFYPGARVGWLAFHSMGKGGKDEWGMIKEAVQKECNRRLALNWEFQEGVAATLVKDVDPYLVDVKKTLIERKKALEKATSGLPLSYPEPNGAFYAFMKIKSGKWEGKRDWDFIRAALKATDKGGVVLVPGSGFGKQTDGTYFRTTFLPPPEIIKRAFEMIGNIL